MSRVELGRLLAKVSEMLISAKKNAKATKRSAIEISASARHSPSQSGDREHASNQAALVEDRKNNLLSLKKEIEHALHENVKTATPPCFLKIEKEGSETDSFYLVNHLAMVDGFRLVSVSSPLGSKLVGKKENASFTIDEPSVKGKMLKIA